MTRTITYAQAINDATDICLAKDKSVILIGEGVPDPKGIFGTTLSLQEKYGKDRVFDMAIAENGMTGICIGAAISGLRPIMVHQRIDFTLLAFDQIANNAAKWFYMFGGKKSVPIVIRMLVGRGWGQGSQHSQSLQALYAHIPGLKVVMPVFPADAKGMLITSIEDNNPVIFIEHRWLHNISGNVKSGYYKDYLDKAKVVRTGKDLTIVAISYMVLEALRASEILKTEGIQAEVIDLRSVKPVDTKTIFKSVGKTGRLLVADTGCLSFGVGSEIVSHVAGNIFSGLKCAPKKIGLPDVPTPTSWKIAEKYYPDYSDIVEESLKILKVPEDKKGRIMKKIRIGKAVRSDVPDNSFKGPF